MSDDTWKEIPSLVRRAREVATVNIAIATLKREFIALVAPFMGWLTSNTKEPTP